MAGPGDRLFRTTQSLRRFEYGPRSVTAAGVAYGGLGGNQPITLSGDVTGTGKTAINAQIALGAVGTAEIANGAVTYDKQQSVAAARLVGNPTGSVAAHSEISLGANLSFVGTVLQASAGQIFYCDSTDAADVATYKRMLLTPSTHVESSVAVSCTGTSDVLVGSFITDAGVPGAIEYPAGSAYRRLYGSVSAGVARFHLQVYTRTTGGIETLARDEFSNSFSNTVAALQEWLATPAGGGVLAATDRLVVKIYAQRVSGPTTITVTFYAEGSLHASQVQTTISLGASAPISATAPLALTGGNLTIATPTSVANGGTGATTAAAALTNLGGAPLASPVFTGDPQSVTPATADNDTSIATTAFVKAQAYIRTIAVQRFTASGTYTPTAGIKYAVIRCKGGGGAGGSSLGGASAYAAGAGGGEGASTTAFATAAQIGASQTVTIGAGGTPAAAGNNQGGGGVTTSVGTLCTAPGGSGGSGGSSSTTVGLSGGGGGAGFGTSTATVVQLSGGMQGDGGISSFSGGAIVSGTGGGQGGAGAQVIGNNGGIAAAANTGGGGSGGASTTVSQQGGAGGSGVVEITEYVA